MLPTYTITITIANARSPEIDFGCDKVVTSMADAIPNLLWECSEGFCNSVVVSILKNQPYTDKEVEPVIATWNSQFKDFQ